jgi:hypothetical protein
VSENHSPIMDRMGVDLDANDVAAAVWEAVNGGASSVHRPVGLQFSATMLAARLAPPRLTRALVRFITGQ